MADFPFPVHCPLILDGRDAQFVFHPGMLFDSPCKWWTPDEGNRASLHEGLDLCLVHPRQGQEPQPLPAGTPVTPVAKGRVAALLPDFLGHTVICSHGLDEGGGGEWISLLAHIRPHPDLRPGMPQAPGHITGWTGTFARPRGMLGHLHLSLGLLSTPYDYDLSWPELIHRTRVHFFDPLPHLPIRSQTWEDLRNWSQFLDRQSTIYS